MTFPLPEMDPCYFVAPRRENSNRTFEPPHLARLEEKRRADHLNYAVVTEGKRATAQQLRQLCR